MSEFNTWSDPTESMEDVMPLEVVPTNYIIDGAGNHCRLPAGLFAVGR